MVELFITIFQFFQALYKKSQDHKFQALFLFILLILMGGTSFYRYAEGWSTLDAFYFSVTTLATVGYGDLAPATSLSKIFTVIYIFAGVGVFLSFINIVGRHTEKQNPIKKLAKFRENESKDKLTVL